MSYNDSFLKHYGVLGMRWGITRTRNRNGIFEVHGRNVARQILSDKKISDISSKVLDIGRRWVSKKLNHGSFGKAGGSRGSSSGRFF